MLYTELESLPLWQINLTEGCHLTVIQSTSNQQAALALSFAAGSHHEPPEYLGMAHFLEHLVFRGSQNYSSSNGLMAFIQQHAGQVNAQTQGQQTNFHFQVDVTVLLEALKRLVDMLVAPLLAPAALSSEREVLEEEFALYCRAPQVLMDAALASCLATEHPLQYFYAGNRDSLAIEDPKFIGALKDFHRRAYLRSELNIVLVLPQPWPHWRADVLQVLQPLVAPVRNLPIKRLPELQLKSAAAIKLCLPSPQTYWVVHLPINQAGQGLTELVEKTQHALLLSAEQGFLQVARQRGWCADINFRASFSAQDQGVFSIYFSAATTEQANLLAAFHQWLRQWRQVLGTPRQEAYERQAQADRWLLSQPLQQAQQILARGWPMTLGVSASCLAALDAVLRAFNVGAMAQIQASPDPIGGYYNHGIPLQVQAVTAVTASSVSVPTFTSVQLDIGEHSAQFNGCATGNGSVVQSALRHYQPQRFPQGVAVCYWGWAVEGASLIAQSLPRHLATLTDVLCYHAVRWQVEVVSDVVFIVVSGPEHYLPNAMQQILNQLEQPFTAEPAQPQAPFALRRLLQRLPIALVDAMQRAPRVVSLSSQPQYALLIGHETVGLRMQRLDSRYLQRLHTLEFELSQMPAAVGWQQVEEGHTDETLLVLYMPLPVLGQAHKDQLRLFNCVFAQHLQRRLQHVLRDEKALCYAVFAQAYEQGGHEGISCALQSSKVGAQYLLAEIQRCLAALQVQLLSEVSDLKLDFAVHAQRRVQAQWGYEALSKSVFHQWCEQRLEFGLHTGSHAPQVFSQALFADYCQEIQKDQYWLILSNQPSGD